MGSIDRDSLARMLVEKITSLPVERIAEIEDFVDFLREREQERGLSQAATAVSEPSFAQVWSNPDDDIYDSL